jgi:hypothetical protein
MQYTAKTIPLIFLHIIGGFSLEGPQNFLSSHFIPPRAAKFSFLGLETVYGTISSGEPWNGELLKGSFPRESL